MLPKKLTIAICTFNRAKLLTHCLDSIHPQVTPDVELIVIDNGKEKVNTICSKYDGLLYYTEDNTGLSYARNKAIEVSHGEYVLYLDDDAKAAPNFVEIALNACDEGYDIFGGVYHPWYHYGRPKWFKDEYASNKMPYTSTTKLSSGEYLSGGIMAYKKEVFKQIGLFHTDIGMIGTKVGYGEESELQDRARRHGLSLYYLPQLEMDHLVAKYKLSVNWFLKAYWKRGEDQAKHDKGNKFLKIIKALIIAVPLFVVDGLRNGIKLLMTKEYYFENWKIDTLKKFYKRMGYISQLINAKG